MPNKPTTIPRVPIETPMFQLPVGQQLDMTQPFPWNLVLSREWIIFWERLFNGGKGGPWSHGVELYDLTVGNNIAPVQTIHPVAGGYLLYAIGTLRKGVTLDLTLRINVIRSGAGVKQFSLTIPHATAVDTPIVFNSFNAYQFEDLDVITWDITASDGSTDNASIATYEFWWL